MKGRVFASADWHGCGKVAKKVLNYLKPEDKLYFLGDAIDRGPNSLELFDLLYERPNTVFLRGNHEDMMYNALITEIKNFDEYPFPGYIDYQSLEAIQWFSNGGINTITDKEGKRIDFNKLKSYLPKIRNLSCIAEIYDSPEGHSVILEHAGYTPCIPSHRRHDPLWDRDHFNDPWNVFLEEDDFIENTYMVHGHTPVQYLKYEYGYRNQPKLTSKDFENKRCWFENGICDKPEIIRYCEGHKFDIDLCTISSKRIALLDLDTFETIYFDED